MNTPYIHIKGGFSLQGTVPASGSKNAVLPILFATLLADGEYKLCNVPDLADVTTALEVLQSVGCSFIRDKNVLHIKSSYQNNTYPPKELVQKMRASFLCLGPLLARKREVTIPLPGGCEIGKRPVDLHLKGLKALGAQIVHKEAAVYAKALNGLKGARIDLDFPTVGGTENLIMASVLADGTTVLKNRACEPEISELISSLKIMGAQIEETGDKELTIQGVRTLHPFSHYKVGPDRIETGTLLLAGAITGGQVQVTNCKPSDLKAVIDILQDCGFVFDIQSESITLKSTDVKKSVDIETGVYPKFPTDLQSPFIALMTQLNGQSSLKECIFENRFHFVKELNKLQAFANIKKDTVFINGPVSLRGNHVISTDLRASSGLVLAALVAKGSTYITNLMHLDRGYENLHIKMKSLGACIERSDEI